MSFVVVVVVLNIIVFLSSVVGWSTLLFRFLFVSCCCHSSFGCDHALRSQSSCDDHNDVLLFMRLDVVYVLFMRLNVTRSSADSGCLHTAPHLGAAFSLERLVVD